MVREYEFKVGISSIWPANKQIVGMQTEKNATTVKFIVDETVREKMSTGILKYRFEAIDSLGGVDLGELKEISWESGAEKERTFEFVAPESLTRNGGSCEVYLIIACFNEEGKDLYEWRSRPALLDFVGVENSGPAMDEERESLSALAQQALSAVKATEEIKGSIDKNQENLSLLLKETSLVVEKAENVKCEIEAADRLVDEKLEEVEGILQGVYNGISEVV